MRKMIATLMTLAFVFTMAVPMTAFADDPPKLVVTEEAKPDPAPKTILVRPGGVLVNAPVDVNVTVPDTTTVDGRLDVYLLNPPPVPKVETKSWCARNPGWCAGIIIVSTAVATGVGFGVADHYGAFDTHHRR